MCLWFISFDFMIKNYVESKKRFNISWWDGGQFFIFGYISRVFFFCSLYIFVSVFLYFLRFIYRSFFLSFGLYKCLLFFKIQRLKDYFFGKLFFLFFIIYVIVILILQVFIGILLLLFCVKNVIKFFMDKFSRRYFDF